MTGALRATVAPNGALSVAERGYPHPRSGAEAGRTPCPKGGSQEELLHVRGQGQWPRVPGCNGAGTAEKSYPSPRSGAVAERSYPMPPHPRPGVAAERSYLKPKARGGVQVDQPHAQGQGWRPGGPTPRPRSIGCMGAGGPRGTIPP